MLWLGVIIRRRLDLWGLPGDVETRVVDLGRIGKNGDSLRLLVGVDLEEISQFLHGDFLPGLEVLVDVSDDYPSDVLAGELSDVGGQQQRVKLVLAQPAVTISVELLQEGKRRFVPLHELLKLVYADADHLLLHLVLPRLFLTHFPLIDQCAQGSVQLLQVAEVNHHLFTREFIIDLLGVKVGVGFNMEEADDAEELELTECDLVDGLEVGEELGEGDADGL